MTTKKVSKARRRKGRVILNETAYRAAYARLKDINKMHIAEIDNIDEIVRQYENNLESVEVATLMAAVDALQRQHLMLALKQQVLDEIRRMEMDVIFELVMNIYDWKRKRSEPVIDNVVKHLTVISKEHEHWQDNREKLEFVVSQLETILANRAETSLTEIMGRSGFVKPEKLK